MSEGAGQQEIVIITGLSGAGRSTAAKSLEDLDWFVADNLPADLLPTMADLARRASEAVPRLAAVIDIRSRAFSTDLKSAIGDLNARGVRPYVVFLEASDETLVRRFDSVARPHPLQEGGRIVDGITAERELLQGMRAEADLILDTSALNVHELRSRMRDAFATEADAENLVGVGNHRQPGDRCQRMPRGFRRRGRRLRQRIGRDRGLQIGKLAAQHGAEVDRFRAVDKAPGRGAIDFETSELHLNS